MSFCRPLAAMAILLLAGCDGTTDPKELPSPTEPVGPVDAKMPDPPPASQPVPQPMSKRIDLQRLGSCPEVEAYFEKLAAQDPSQQRGGAGGGSNLQSVTTASFSDGPAETGATADGNFAKDYSQTNIQESGVDEADIIKNDAEKIYILSANQLVVVDAWAPQDMKEIRRYHIEGRPLEMVVEGNLAVVFSSVSKDEVLEGKFKRSSSRAAHPRFDGTSPILKVTVLDLSDGAAEPVMREFYAEGQYVTSRLSEGVVRWVLSSRALTPALLLGSPFVDTKTALDALGIEDWIPRYVDAVRSVDGRVEKKGLLVECEDFFVPSLPNGLGILAVVTIDLARPTEKLTDVAIVGEPGVVYASSKALYLAGDAYSQSQLRAVGESLAEATAIHKFDIESDRSRVLYRASGAVEGHILNQFSLGEHKGFLRVATTGDGSAGGSRNSPRNFVYTMGEKDGRLDVTGMIPGIAPGESIYSARFVGERGFVVTFRQVDPLFTVDLSDPFHPRLVGELKVPGFSTYLHPLDDRSLLAIGRDAQNQRGSAWFQSLQLSIFDISDFAHPKLTHKETIGGPGTSSEALYNHKAFNYYGAKSLLAIPIILAEETRTGSEYGIPSFVGLRLYRATAAEGFQFKGDIDHSDFYKEAIMALNGRPGGTPWLGNVQGPSRSVFMEDYVYSISDFGVKVNHMDRPSKTIGVVRLPGSMGRIPYMDR